MLVTSKITKWGNSQGLILPKSLLSEVKITINDDVLISTSEDTIIIKKVNRRRSLAEIFEGRKDYYELKEINCGHSVGKEL